MPATLSTPVRFILSLLLKTYRAVALVFLRLRGGVPADPAEARVVSGEAWDEFCDTLKASGAALLAPGAPKDAFNQAEGYRYLARLARAGLENFLECSDVEAPRLCAIANGSRASDPTTRTTCTRTRRSTAGWSTSSPASAAR